MLKGFDFFVIIKKEHAPWNGYLPWKKHKKKHNSWLYCDHLLNSKILQTILDTKFLNTKVAFIFILNKELIIHILY